ncbi:MAG: hypothetical protein AAGO57_00870, partial [Pseudomonadota bacterium]
MAEPTGAKSKTRYVLGAVIVLIMGLGGYLARPYFDGNNDVVTEAVAVAPELAEPAGSAPETDAATDIATEASEAAEEAEETAVAAMDDAMGEEEETSPDVTALDAGPATEDATASPDSTSNLSEAEMAEETGAEDAATQEPETAGAVESPKAMVPEFDVVRITPDGEALIAGKAEPGAKITVMLDGEAVGEAEADNSGNFVAMFSVGTSADARVIALRAGEDGDLVTSDQEIIVAPMPAPVAETVTDDDAPADQMAATEGGEAAEVAAVDAGDTVAATEDGDRTEAAITEPVLEGTAAEDATQQLETAPTMADAAQSEGTDDGRDLASVAETETPELQETPSTGEPGTVADASTAEDAPAVPQDVAETPEPEAPTLLLSEGGSVRVIQSPTPQVMDEVAIDAITYSVDGDVTLTGRAGTDGFVRVYLDNQPILTTEIAEDGNWRTDLPAVDTGVYTLRVDALDSDGNVTARAETPFLREPVEAVQTFADE